MICLCLVVLLCGCNTPTATLTPNPLPTSTPVPPSATPTLTPSPTSTPTITPTPSPTPLPTWANGFQLGAVVRDISSNAELMLTSGITWVSMQTRTSENAQQLISEAHNSGLRILLTAVQDEKLITDSDYQIRYISLLASLAKQGADAIEIGNEPNIGRNAEILTTAEYTALLCEAYSAIKEANPNTLVISGAPAPTAYFGGCSRRGCDDLLWLQGLAEAGAANCLDYVGAHYLSGATSPREESGHPAGSHYSWYFWPMVERYYEIFGGARPLAFTAFGYASPEGWGLPQTFIWAENTTVAEQAEWTAEAVQMATESNKVGMLIVYNLDYTFSEWEACYALIQPDGSCPACDMLRQLLLQQ